MDPSVLQPKRGNFVAFAAGGLVVLFLLGGVYLLTRGRAAGPAAEPPLPMTPVEQAYAGNIHFSDVHMAQATNFLNQMLTYVYCTVANDGPRPIRRMEVTIEFRDPFGQLILRETHRIPASIEGPIAPGEHREIQFTFENIPAQWNQQYPTLRVTGILLG